MSFGGFDPNDNPLGGIFGDIARLLGQQSGALNWDVAKQIALLIASEGQPTANVDPSQRIQLEQLSRIAQLHVEQASGVSLDVPDVQALSRVDWALRTLDDYRSPLEQLAAALDPTGQEVPSSGKKDDGFHIPDSLEGLEETLASPPSDSSDVFPSTSTQPDNNQAEFGQLAGFMAPVVLGMQIGGMVGHLSRKSLAMFDTPIPRGECKTLAFLPVNIAEFATAWNLPFDELVLYVAAEELARLTILHRPHVRERFDALIKTYVSGFRADFSGLVERFVGLDVSDPTALPDQLIDEETILTTMQTPAQQRTLLQLESLTAAFVGHVDFIVDTVTRRIVPSAPAIREANKRRRVEEARGERLLERMLGIQLGQAQYDRGEAFIHGLLERGQEESVLRLWRNAKELPTPSELAAPGLWLARIGL